MNVSKSFTFESSSKSVCLEKELWTARICAALLRVSPLLYASNDMQNSLKSVKVVPSLRSACLQFNKRLRMAWVAHALLMTYQLIENLINSYTDASSRSSHTCLAKNIFSSRLSWTIGPAGSSCCTHLNRNIKPWMGLRIIGKIKFNEKWIILRHSL